MQYITFRKEEKINKKNNVNRYAKPLMHRRIFFSPLNILGPGLEEKKINHVLVTTD